MRTAILLRIQTNRRQANGGTDHRTGLLLNVQPRNINDLPNCSLQNDYAFARQFLDCGDSESGAELTTESTIDIGAPRSRTTPPKLERIVAWCASHPDEVPFALHQFLGRRDKQPPEAT